MSCNTLAHADTSSDIYKRYGLGNTEFVTVKAEETKYRLLYENLCKQVNSAKQYNKAVMDNPLPRVLQKLNAYIKEKENTEIKLYNSFDASISEISTIDNRYNYILEQISMLEKALSSYSNIKKKNVPIQKLQSAYKKYKSLMAKRKKLEKDTEVGEVNKIVNFIQAPYVIQSKFNGKYTTYKTAKNTGILSVFKGNVIFSDCTEDEGETIVIQSPSGIRVTYFDLLSRYVKKGDKVNQYQKIASTNKNIKIRLSINNKDYDLDKLFRR